ncbi:MAG: mechanosensitive ion channel domain-containing protein [Bacteroidota bacterium]
MNFNEFFQQILFESGNYSLTIRHLTLWLVVLILTFLIYRLFTRKFLPKYFEREKYVIRDNKKIARSIRNIFIIIALIGTVWTLQFNYLLFEMNEIRIRISTILYAITVLQVAELLDWLASKILVYNYHRSRTELDPETSVEKFSKETQQTGGNLVRVVVYVAAIFLVLQSFNLEDYVVLHPGDYELRVADIVEAILILLSARLVYWVVTQLVLYRYYQRSDIHIGARYAINQLLKYVIYTMAVLWAISSLGVQMTVLWGGAAALLVGVGLGLQQTFNDFFSGIILLFERSVEVGDVLDIGGLVGTVKQIGLRTSIIETRDNITVVVPNSKLVTDNVTNWSHFDKKARFVVGVGVAYGSDTKLVKELLLQAAHENPLVIEQPSPFVRFTDFGDSSLNFELHFFSRNFITIEDVKSDLRFRIDDLFRKNNVEIPFPQRVVWMKNSEVPKEDIPQNNQ